jgi:uncharacterized integral membrane protein (TIGR00698 family)
VPGLALSAVITGVALWAGSFPTVAGAGFSALTLAILLGMVVGNTVYPQITKSCDGGVIFAKQHLLRLGIILYGFRLTFSQIADVGVSGIAIDALTLTSTFLLACFIGQKVFGLDKQTSWLIGAGSSICGAAGGACFRACGQSGIQQSHRSRRHCGDIRYAGDFPVPRHVSAGGTLVYP